MMGVVMGETYEEAEWKADEARLLKRIAELEAAIGQLSDAHRKTAADLGECKERLRRSGYAPEAPTPEAK